MDEVTWSPGLAANLMDQYVVDPPSKNIYCNITEEEDILEMYNEPSLPPPSVPSYAWNRSINIL